MRENLTPEAKEAQAELDADAAQEQAVQEEQENM